MQVVSSVEHLHEVHLGEVTKGWGKNLKTPQSSKLPKKILQLKYAFKIMIKRQWQKKLNSYHQNYHLLIMEYLNIHQKTTVTTILRTPKEEDNQTKYQPSGEGGARSPPATPHRLQNPKWPPGGPKMVDGVWKGVYP